MKRNEILRRNACFRCGVRLNQSKCPIGICTKKQMKAKRDLALDVHAKKERAAKLAKRRVA